MQSITVLIVGQVRNQHVLLRSIDNLVAARARGLVDRVILATWTEEWRKVPALHARLEAAGVSVVTTDEPDAKWLAPGNILYQMRGLDLALEGVEDTAWVLRSRPDVVIDGDLLAALAGADMRLAPAHTALSHRIWTPNIEACQPLCLGDIIYFGCYADIAKLQNFDVFHEVARTHLVTPDGKPVTSYDGEVRRFTPAFAPAYPVLAEYYRLSNRFFLGIHELRRSMLNALYREELYWQYMAAYFDIIRKYVLVGHDLVSTPVLLARPQAIDQAEGVACLDLTRCGYAGQALAQAPDPAATVELFSQAPIYCSRTDDVEAVTTHLDRIGADLPRRLGSAMAYRKDAARIAALQGFRDRLNAALAAGVEIGRPKVSAWHHPFDTRFVDFN